jgi:phosphatidate cytidylyltransferase
LAHKELIKRSISGILFAGILIFAAQNRITFLVLILIFGLITLLEFNRLIKQKNPFSYLIFIFIFFVFGFLDLIIKIPDGINEISQIIHVISLFVLLFLTRDLFSSKSLPKLLTNRYINTTFYISCGFIFLILISLNSGSFSSNTIVGMFVLIWINDSFAYLIGSNFGRQKLFESVSPKKTVEGFLGGVFFSAIGSYFIFKYTNNLEFSNWLIISVITSVFGTIGDLIESKYKRQANVKDSGNLMPGHGGLLDRLDSAIFVAPFIYLFLKILNYVS